jgi:hypothetical protein
MRARALPYIKHVLCFALLASGLVLMMQSAAWAVSVVSLNPATQPPSGLAGTGAAYLTGFNFPAGAIPPAGVTVFFAASCLGTPIASTTATQVNTIPVPPVGAVRRIRFVIPGTLATGTYSVWVTDAGLGISSSDCSALMVTNSTPKIAACLPSSSLAVSLGSTVTAYVPHGDWSSANTGIGVLNIEGPAASATIATPNVVNACSADSITGEVVCTANNPDVYLITGTTLNTTLTSGANAFASFSGGSCNNCGVAIDAANNFAYIEEGLTGGTSGQGVQPLNLATNTFGAAFPMHFKVSENIAIDPFLNLVLSPGEDSNYTILGIAPDGSISGEFGMPVSEFDLDSAAEDCTTGIALAASEFTEDIFIEDLTQAIFTSGTPGSYTAPGQFQTLAGGFFSAGTSGISVAPGSTHLAVVTGEFGGSLFAALQLPSTSGSGTPALVDYAEASIPGNPAGGSCGFFSAGLDPHTVTAYTSPMRIPATPDDGKAFALFVGNSATCLVRVDLAAIIAAPRIALTHTVTAFPAGAITYYTIP